MSSVDKLVKLADRFVRKLSLAQMEDPSVETPPAETPPVASPLLSGSAQAGDIQEALKAAGLWEKSAEVSPLLNAAGVADDASVKITIVVDSKLDVKYRVDTKPPAAAIKLAALLRAKYGAAMKAAIAKAGLTVSDTVEVAWLTF